MLFLLPAVPFQPFSSASFCTRRMRWVSPRLAVFLRYKDFQEPLPHTHR